MKLRLNRLFSRMLSNKGYTIDQTILIVAIIAILITLVIVTVGWQLINRAGGTRAGAQIKQVEDANGAFFSDQRVWPHLAYSSPAASPANNMRALVNNGITTWNGNITVATLKNQLPGFKVDATNGVQHTMGSGGAVTEDDNTMSTVGTDHRIVVQFANVPVTDAQEADKAIDGTIDNKSGRLLYSASTCLGSTAGATKIPTDTPTSGVVYICYGANSIQ